VSILIGIGLIILYVFGWQMAKLFDQRFLEEKHQKAIPLNSGYNDMLDNRSIIRSMKRKREEMHGTTTKRKEISDGRPGDRDRHHRRHLAQAGRRGDGKNVLPHNPRGDV
jgi:hypothetical protein